MTNNGYSVITEPDGSLAVKVNYIKFGGVIWSYVSFSFVNGYLSQVWFQNNERQSITRLDDIYNKIIKIYKLI